MEVHNKTAVEGGSGSLAQRFWGSLLMALIMAGAWHAGALQWEVAGLLGVAALVGCLWCSMKLLGRPLRRQQSRECFE